MDYTILYKLDKMFIYELFQLKRVIKEYLFLVKNGLEHNPIDVQSIRQNIIQFKVLEKNRSRYNTLIDVMNDFYLDFLNKDLRILRGDQKRLNRHLSIQIMVECFSKNNTKIHYKDVMDEFKLTPVFLTA